MIPVRGALYLVGAALAAFLLFWGYGVYQRSKSEEIKAWERAVDSVSTLRARADTVYDTTRVGYVQYRDRILRSGTATTRDSATFKKADAVVAACDTLQIASRAVESVLRDKPSGIRRVQLYGEALYDFANTVPVVRVGATAKVFGPINLSVAGEYAAPPAGQNTPAFRALAGVRINF